MIATLTVALVLNPQSGFSLEKPVVALGQRVIAMAAAPTGSKVVVCLENYTARIIDTKTRQTLRVLQGHPAPAYAAAWSPNGKLVATGDESARVILWDAASGKRVRTIRDHTKGIQALSFNSSGAMLLSTGKDDTMYVYTLKDGKRRATILGKGANLYSGRFVGKSNNILCASLGKGAMAFTANGQPIYALGGHGGEGVWEAALNPSGTLIASAGRDGTVGIWSTKTRQRLNSLRGHTDWVVRVLFTPDGKHVITSSVDGTVRVWNASNYKQVAMLTGQSMVGSPICLTADGKTLLTADVSDFLQYNRIQSK